MNAGSKGTKKCQREWGDHLIAVRYRRDTVSRSLLTTVEIVVDRRAEFGSTAKNISRDKPVALRVDYAEADLRLKVKSAGARWSKQLKLWITTYSVAQN
ncbi:MAG: hypothetical protein JKX99_03935 [Robiginitomaculum sp.]|nr:hypothetical protein [Robiginitomaculum sp.]